MGGFLRFEDIEAWQVGMELTVQLHALFGGDRGHGHFWLKDQVLRAAISITCNIAEGFGRGSDAEFARFLSYARGSAVEVESCLYVAERVSFLSLAQAEPLREQAHRCSQMVSKLQSYLQPQRLRDTEESYHA